MINSIHQSRLLSLLAEMRPKDSEESRYLRDRIKRLERDNEYLRQQLAAANARLCAK